MNATIDERRSAAESPPLQGRDRECHCGACVNSSRGRAHGEKKGRERMTMKDANVVAHFGLSGKAAAATRRRFEEAGAS